MTVTELTGWAAAALTLLAFNSRDVRLLRLASVGASVAFITYGAATSTWPVLALHCVLLPVNLFRLFELHRASRRLQPQDLPRPQDRHHPQPPQPPQHPQPPQRSPALSCACGRTPVKTSRRWPRIVLMTLAFISSGMPTSAQAAQAEHLHARALASPCH